MAKEVTEFDRDLGERIKTLRKVRSMSQTELAATIGVTFQQMQKYEKGINRMSVAAFVQFCRTLRVAPGELIGHHVTGESAPDTAALMLELQALRSKLAKIEGVLA